MRLMGIKGRKTTEAGEGKREEKTKTRECVISTEERGDSLGTEGRITEQGKEGRDKIYTIPAWTAKIETTTREKEGFQEKRGKIGEKAIDPIPKKQKSYKRIEGSRYQTSGVRIRLGPHGGKRTLREEGGGG